jgi:hypothetical protein
VNFMRKGPCRRFGLVEGCAGGSPALSEGSEKFDLVPNGSSARQNGIYNFLPRTVRVGRVMRGRVGRIVLPGSIRIISPTDPPLQFLHADGSGWSSHVRAGQSEIFMRFHPVILPDRPAPTISCRGRFRLVESCTGDAFGSHLVVRGRF